MKNCRYCGGEPELQATRTATGVSAFVRCGVCGRSVKVNAATIAEAANEVERRWETETRGEAIMQGNAGRNRNDFARDRGSGKAAMRAFERTRRE